MGKATRWLRALLGMKREKNADQISYSSAGDKKEKNRWSFSKSGKEFTGKVQTLPPPPPRKAVADADWQRSYPAQSEEERNEHSIAVAAASAAAADAAVMAAQAAVAVVRLTNQTRGGLLNGGKEIMAALKIQNVFRGYLARKALRALRGLVKLQAVVRGFVVRKRAAATLQSMQALIRAQTTVRLQQQRARLHSHNKENNPKKSPERPHQILEIDTLFNSNSNSNSKSRSRRFNSLLSELPDHRPPPYFWTMVSPARFSTPTTARRLHDLEWGFIGSAHSTPRVTPTPARSVFGEGYFRPCTNYPNYMANTKSFKAKLRSRSAPKQRPNPELWTKKRVALNEIMGPRNSISSLTTHTTCNPGGEAPDHGFHEF